jgi:hypothetical protein
MSSPLGPLFQTVYEVFSPVKPGTRVASAKIDSAFSGLLAEAGLSEKLKVGHVIIDMPHNVIQVGVQIRDLGDRYSDHDQDTDPYDALKRLSQIVQGHKTEFHLSGIKNRGNWAWNGSDCNYSFQGNVETSDQLVDALHEAGRLLRSNQPVSSPVRDNLTSAKPDTGLAPVGAS